MSSFEEMLSKTTSKLADSRSMDHIKLPTSISQEKARREREEAAAIAQESALAEERKDAVNDEETPGHFGSTGGSGGSSSGAGISGMDDIVQRDDPDDGEHLESRATEAAEEDVEEEPEEVVAEPEPPQVEQEVVAPPEEDTEETDDVEAELKLAEKKLIAQNMNNPVVRQVGAERIELPEKAGYRVGSGDTAVLKVLPKVLVDALRKSLEPAVGLDYSQGLSAPSIVTAFLMARLGIDVDVDTNTKAAADAFRTVDTRMVAVEDTLEEMRGDMITMAAGMQVMAKRLSQNNGIVEAVELSNSWLIASQLDASLPASMRSSNVEVLTKEALTVRDRVRKSTKDQALHDKRREGRSL